jgi:hypothetical protein
MNFWQTLRLIPSLLFLTGALTACDKVRNFTLLVPSWSGFEKIADHVWVDNQMPPPQREEFIDILNSARQRARHFIGDLQGNANIFACSTEACYRDAGGGSSKGIALGDAALLLSPRGLDVVILCHELVHIELHHRIGVLRSANTIPSWFDEGLAVLISEDPRYSESAWLDATSNGRKIPSLNDISRLLGNGEWLISYGTARREVGLWYRTVGGAGLARLINQVRDGAPFEQIYGTHFVEAHKASALPEGKNLGGY